MKATNILTLIIVFGLGWVLNGVFADFGLEQPAVITGNAALERDSPSDIISQENIHVYEDRVVIEIENPRWATFTDTNSMDPVFDEGSHALQVVPQRPEDIDAGDIISYQKGEDIIIHRVVETGVDKLGWYAITKGDNNAYYDVDKVRFLQVKKLLVGIIY